MLENFKIAAELYLTAGDVAFSNSEKNVKILRKTNPVDQILKKDFIKTLTWAIRSYARSKVCYTDIGDSEEASIAYIKDQDARTLLYSQQKPLSKYYWNYLRKTITNYGESISTWLIWFLIVTICFDLIYYGLQSWVNWPQKPTNYFLLDGIYLYLATTLGFGEIISVPWQAKIVLLLNLISGYTMLALGIDIIIRKFKSS